MQLSLDELDRRLDSLDEVISLMLKDQTDREYMLAVVASAAEGIQSLAGPHQDYVSARVLEIVTAHGLGLRPAADEDPT
jgi:hypothetical protein